MKKLRNFLVGALSLVAVVSFGNFITSNGSLPPTKRDLTPLPPGADPTRYIQAADYNALMNAILDTRTNFINGTFMGFLPQASHPTPPVSGSPYNVWVNSSNNDLYYTANGVDTNITIGGGGGGVSLSNPNTWTATQNVASVALSDGATISTNAQLGNSFGVTIAGNRTMANPTNLVSGGTYQWEVIQDATGSRTITWGGTFTWPGASAPALQTAANAKDLISCYYDGTSLLCGSLAGNGGGGGVTSVAAGTGMSFSTITSTGTVAVDTTVVATTTNTIAMSNKTETAPVIASGLTASGSAANDFSGSTGAFKTSTGVGTFGGSSNSFTNGAGVDSSHQNAFPSINGSTYSTLLTVIDHYSLIVSAGVNGATNGGSGNTTGQLIMFKQAIGSVSGIKFWWIGGAGALTVKCSFWNPSNSVIGTGTVAVNAAGSYSVAFTPVAITTSTLYETYAIGCWDNSNANYTYVSTAPGRPGSSTCSIAYEKSQWIQVTSDCEYHAGDHVPDTSIGGASQYFPVELVYQP